MLLELASIAIFVRCDDELMATVLEELAQAELARNATEEITWGEVDCTGTRGRGPIGIPLNLRLGGRK